MIPVDVLVIIAVAVGFILVSLSIALGVGIGREREANRHADAAAVTCPTCTSVLAEARRLDRVGARVKTVEYSAGQYVPGFEFPHGPDPVDDANAIVRAMRRHLERVDRDVVIPIGHRR